MAWTENAGDGFRITGRHVLGAMIAFFGAIFAVNIIFVWLALESFPGIDTEDPFRKGLKYNETIAASEAQAALGWSSELALDASGALRVTLKDRTGGAVTGLALAATVGRIATNRDNVDVTARETAPGVYGFALPEMAGGYAGYWLVRVTARDGAGAVVQRLEAKLRG